MAKFSQDPVDPHQGFEISQFNEVSRDPLLRYHMARSADISQDLLILALICYIKSMKFNSKVFKFQIALCPFCSRLQLEALQERLASAKKPFLRSGPMCCCSWTKVMRLQCTGHITIWLFTWHAVNCHLKFRYHLLIEVRFALKGRNTGDIRPSYH